MKKMLRILFFGFTLMELYQIGQRMSLKKNIISRLLARWCKHKMNTQYGCYLSFKSNISPNCKFIHPVGIVIGEGVVIAEGCQIYQGVTIGAARQNEFSSNRYPKIEKNCTLFAGAKLIGSITIGENTVIGANAVVTKNISANTVAAGIPAKTIKTYPE